MTHPNMQKDFTIPCTTHLKCLTYIMNINILQTTVIKQLKLEDTAAFRMTNTSHEQHSAH